MFWAAIYHYLLLQKFGDSMFYKDVFSSSEIIILLQIHRFWAYEAGSWYFLYKGRSWSFLTISRLTCSQWSVQKEQKDRHGLCFEGAWSNPEGSEMMTKLVNVMLPQPTSWDLMEPVSTAGQTPRNCFPLFVLLQLISSSHQLLWFLCAYTGWQVTNLYL